MFTIMLLSMFILGSIFFALVAGDIVAKENEDGNLRLVFSREYKLPQLSPNPLRKVAS
jgi:ABC-type transport system involved in multi-copper enzyme maturation permease subunit